MHSLFDKTFSPFETDDKSERFELKSKFNKECDKKVDAFEYNHEQAKIEEKKECQVSKSLLVRQRKHNTAIRENHQSSMSVNELIMLIAAAELEQREMLEEHNMLVANLNNNHAIIKDQARQLKQIRRQILFHKCNKHITLKETNEWITHS